MIVSKKHKRLVLRLREPDKVFTLIPKAKPLLFKGTKLAVVPHKTPAVRVLNNIGIKAPAPVDYYYDWPGRFEPMDAQRETVRFLTSHQRGYCLNDIGCVDSETEYLTPTGWRKISEYDGGLVAQYHPDTGAAEFVEPTEYVKKPCSTMFRIKTKYGVDQLLSPEHRVLLTAKDNPGKHEVVQAAELYARQEQWLETGKNKKSLTSIGWSNAAIPATYATTPDTALGMTDQALRVQVAVIADGHFPNGTNRCVVRLKKDRKKLRLRQLLSAAKIQWAEREQNTDTAQGFTVFSFEAPRRDKEFGPAYWSASEAQLAVVRDEVMHWDGCFRAGKPLREFTTNDKPSADFVQYAFNVGGHVARITVDQRGPTYSVLVRDNGRGLQLASNSAGKRNRVMEPVPSPDGFKYCFMVPSTFLVLRRNGCVFASGNTGKTMSTLWAYDFLKKEGTVDKMLVIAPLSTLERTWADEIFQHFPHLSFSVVHDPSKARRLQKLQRDADVYIINPDGVKVIQDELMGRKFDVVVIDEIAQSARNQRTETWKTFKKITKGVEFLWGLTGTPVPNGPLDAWAQCRLVTPHTVPQFFTHWRVKTMEQIPGNAFKWIAKPDAMQSVEAAMQPAVRFRRDDCIDLPPVMYETRSVEMSPDQQRLYRDMKDKYYAMYKGGEITAANAAVQAQKLVQIASGAAYDPEGKPVVVLPQSRITATLEVIEEAPAKVIVFVPFKASLQMLADELAKDHTVARIDGTVSSTQRSRIFGDFMKQDDPKVLVAQPAAMSHGLTLTAASVVVWFAPVTSAETYEQANGRITRPGQKNNQLIIHIEGSSAERRIYTALKKKTGFQAQLLELFQSKD